jgi:hypothetical protein
MYTVLRITPVKEDCSIDVLAERFGKLLPELFDGLDRVEDRFSCTVCDNPDWIEHERSIRKTVAQLKRFSEVSQGSFSAEMDCAVYPSEFEAGELFNSVQLTPDLMDLLVREKIGMVFTIYREKV